MQTSLLQKMIEQLQCLPGVGPKTAQRMAYHLLQHKRQAGTELANTLATGLAEIGQCKQCRNYTELELCDICTNSRRTQNTLLCIVESVSDLAAVEQSGHFSGRYFVLHGCLSPIDGVGPRELGLSQLEEVLASDGSDPSKPLVEEVILALNPSVEGEATSHYIADICKSNNVAITRIAHGIPVGGELEMVDTSTMSHALMGRKQF